MAYIMLKYLILIATIVIKENVILRQIPKCFRVKGRVSSIYSQMGQERNRVCNINRSVETEVVIAARYK